MKNYNQLTPGLISRLKEIAGDRFVITSADDMEPYSHDETATLKAMPWAVVKPENTDQISRIMQLAQNEKIPVTPRGAGTGLSGGAVPLYGGILLSTERLNKILEIDTENLMAVTQPGVITAELQRAAEAKGLFYPPDPASLESCFIGGNIAENSGGPRAFKYGVTRHYLTGLEVVWPDGRVSRIGGKLIKNVAGYDLLGLVCGSEGTLAVVTEITVRLIPRPPVEVDLLIPFPSIEKGVTAVTEIIKERIMPATMEFMELKSVRAAEAFLKKEAPYRDAPAQLLIQLDGQDKAELEKQYEKIGEIVSNFDAQDVLVAEDKTSKDRLWEVRRAISEAISVKSPVLKKDDVVVPRAKIPELFHRLADLEAKYGFEIVSFGHIGDGNVHVNILKNDKAIEEWNARAPELMKEIMSTVLSLGGSITGEHGVGCVKKDFLPSAIDPAALELMRHIKETLDPNYVLNPGKIFQNC